MEILLKSIKYYEKLSDDSNAFSATLYVNGKKIATVTNDGRGGENQYDLDRSEYAPILQEAMNYAKNLPPVDCEGSKIPNNLDLYIDNQFQEFITESEIKKYVNKNQAKGIVFRGTDNELYVQKLKVFIADLLTNDKSKQSLIDFLVKDIMPLVACVESILNTNIPDDVKKEVKQKSLQKA